MPEQQKGLETSLCSLVPLWTRLLLSLRLQTVSAADASIASARNVSPGQAAGFFAPILSFAARATSGQRGRNAMTEQLTAEQKLAHLVELKAKVAEGGGP